MITAPLKTALAVVKGRGRGLEGGENVELLGVHNSIESF